MTRRIGPHYRVPWNDRDPSYVRVSVKYDIVKSGAGDRGSGRVSQQRYRAAKFQRDFEAAAVIVDQFTKDEWVDRIVDDMLPFLEEGREPIVVWPMPGFAGSDFDHDGKPVTNALPAAIAAYLVEIVGGTLNESIIQIARPGRTKLSKIQRFLFQPKFEGEVDPSAVYLVVDDACTTGGTLASLRTHIVNKGGVIGAIATLCSPNGEDCPFPLASETLEMLLRSYGPDLREFWVEEIGHAVEHLSEGEGRTLRGWGQEQNADRQPILLALRAKFDKVRSRGDE